MFDDQGSDSANRWFVGGGGDAGDAGRWEVDLHWWRVVGVACSGGVVSFRGRK